MAKLGLDTEVVDAGVYDSTVGAFRDAGVLLPTIAQLADPTTIPEAITDALQDIDPDEPHPLNLFRVHWFNDAARTGRVSVPGHVVLPRELTGVDARIVVTFGDRFPMINAHKVLAAYGCLAPRVVTGQFDPTTHRAIWPSTGNYCRGGVAISRIMGCRGVAVLPEGMSRERFEWLEDWVADPSDIVRTVGSESNVKEIYDKCNELDALDDHIIFNQFCEFGNHLVHRVVTGRALQTVFEHLKERDGSLRMRAYVSATGSAGTIAAGDHLKAEYGARIVAMEAAECPTLLYNGFGEHNIQGIGDKHIPYIHNAMNTDFVAAVSDEATDSLFMVFGTEPGRQYLRERLGFDEATIESLSHMGFSAICNVLGAIKTAKYLGLGSDDVVMTVATDGADLYLTEYDKIERERFGGAFDMIHAAESFARFMKGQGTDHLLELRHEDRERIFNLGYFTWVEQQGVDFDDFVARREQRYWDDLLPLVRAWDEQIEAFNAKTGLVSTL
ncbi:MAG: pyridoxal-5'-phosphate-dependent protein subunit beta [Deltaproteobacteria bacterium]|nr:pyridoxal-5'-phosphate-dependent protein subunit beta [Deltaproteobacteria bacterium]